MGKPPKSPEGGLLENDELKESFKKSASINFYYYE